MDVSIKVTQLKPGPASGKPVYRCSIEVGDILTLIDCPVWNGTPGVYSVGPPSVKGSKGGWFKTAQFGPLFQALADQAVQKVINSLPQNG